MKVEVVAALQLGDLLITNRLITRGMMGTRINPRDTFLPAGAVGVYVAPSGKTGMVQVNFFGKFRNYSYYAHWLDVYVADPQTPFGSGLVKVASR